MLASTPTGITLASYTTLGVGGAAERMLDVRTEEQACAALQDAARQKLAVRVLGGGSNLVVADRGVEGLVVRVDIRGIRVEESGDLVRIHAGAGELFDDVVAAAVARDLAGIECLSGIPGTIGATPVQNVGAYGQEIGSCVEEVRALDRQTGAVRRFARAECAFGYRDSVFKQSQRDRWLITQVTLGFGRKRPARACYPELQRALAREEIIDPTPSQLRAKVLALRADKSMLADPRDPNGRSVGSFFTNPHVPRAELEEVQRRATEAGITQPFPQFAAGENIKLSAAWLIEHAGFPKGYGEGRAGLSSRHTLCVVNRGGATAGEIVACAARLRQGVWGRFGVDLRPEPELWGFTEGEVEPLVGSLG